MDAGTLSRDDALVALDYCLNKHAGNSFDEALAQLGCTGEGPVSTASDTMAEESTLSQEVESSSEQPAVQEESAEPGGFNLLAHFGLTGDGGEEQSPQEPEPETAEDEGGKHTPFHRQLKSGKESSR